MSAITSRFDVPFYTGVGTSSDVPGLFQVALNGRPYILDLKPDIRSERYERQSIPILRTQANITNLPDESSINPADLWRRSQETWHKGAGQPYLDKQDSDPARFNISRGVDVWTKWQASLLPGTSSIDATSTTVGLLCSAGTRLYLSSGSQTVKWLTALGGGIGGTVSGTPAANITAITSDGFNVWIGYTASGIYATTRTTGAAASYTTGTVNLVKFVKGRLMASSGPSIYNITVGGGAALPTALKTMSNSDWVWTDFAEGPGMLYACGFSGDKSLIYGTTIKADGTALDEPILKGELPDGEIIRCMQGYLGFLIIGTDLGVRFCTLDGQGNITLGPLLNTGTISVRCLEPQDRFVWFGWTNFRDFVSDVEIDPGQLRGSSGLGRMDLSMFVAPLTPAFATDLMSENSGIVTSVVTFTNKRVFSVLDGGGPVAGAHYYELGTRTPYTAYLNSGVFTYGLPDPKVAMYLDVRSDAMPNGSIAGYVAMDGGAFTLVGSQSIASTIGETYSVGELLGRRFEVQLRFISGTLGTPLTTGPSITRLTLRSYSAPNRGEQWVLPILLHETVLANGGIPHALAVRDEMNLIRQMVADSRLVTYQEGTETHQVFVEDYIFRAHHPTADFEYWNGLMIVTIREASQ